MKRWLFVVTAFLWVGSGFARAGEPQQIQLRWEELNSRILKKNAAFVTPDGTRLEGKVRGVELTGLDMEIMKSSNRKAHPTGKQRIPRDSLSVLRVTEYGKKGRLLGTLAAVGIACGVVAAQQIEVYEGPFVIIIPAIVAAGIGGTAMAGYYTGKAYDKKVIEISIVR